MYTDVIIRKCILTDCK